MSIFFDGKETDFSGVVYLVHSSYLLRVLVVLLLADTVSVNPKIFHVQRQSTRNGMLDSS